MARSRYSLAPQATPAKGTKVPLNDDDEERAKRRHAFAEQQRNSLRASSTPVGKKARRSLAASVIDPHTPTHDLDHDHDMPDVAGSAVTPMKRVMPLASNFEDWIKMATDNKINAANSWNFALIDYFHEMSLLKEGDGVNFQKASCTLDGCVKIYTSRVDSVATDTGKLLSGLAENGNKKRRGADEDGEDGDDGEGEEGEDGQKKKRKRAVRSAEATLATSFEQLQNKKMDLEFAQDPLFKKATADFDEGGAKGLLMNHLAIDANGRIVFDSSDDAGDAPAKDARDASAPGETPQPEDDDDDDDEDEASNDIDIDISGLAAKYFPNLALLDEQDVCPSMKTFDLGDVNGSMDLPFLKAPEDWRQDDKDDAEEEAGNVSGVFLDDDNAGGFDDDDNMGGFDMPPDVGFGEGGEVWAQELALVPNARVHDNDVAEGDEEAGDGGNGEGTDEQQYTLTMNHAREQEHENILSYFDQALKKNWAGPEHWRIRRVKEAGKTAPVTKRKEKEPFEIDFMAPMSQELANALYTPAASAAAISLPKAQWTSKTRNLLPDDKHFNSKNLLRLFLKPKARFGSRRVQKQPQSLARKEEAANGEVDEAFWANRANEEAAADEDDAVKGNYDADFFNDDALPFAGGFADDDAFADARDHFSPPPTQLPLGTQATDMPSSQANAFGADLITQSRRFRPEYVQYARVAKKVDVKRLKDELWTSMGLKEATTPPAADDPPTPALDSPLNFTDVVNNLKQVYPQKALADISTSYCFICTLHLANEQGLVIENTENFEDLTIRRDFTADLSVGN
ncbi:uncharacterized protein EKO05_0007984 [Ascochyta rabiei]|uniref:Condensin complex subunit 2 n=1 Tax=Didymella rabiei TaxID=5454 RepID=A0A163B897_DIDRA|nr:uncharacterized protein EKO05_0007984 [Ascochyta rabiei]KZM21621.1 mitotic chromosome condensation [Ascochyta rabiei]UPX17643.1 hypothetical protein EKO05_0007984 [Ascochyta rabiei]